MVHSYMPIIQSVFNCFKLQLGGLSEVILENRRGAKIPPCQIVTRRGFGKTDLVLEGTVGKVGV